MLDKVLTKAVSGSFQATGGAAPPPLSFSTSNNERDHDVT